MANTLITPSVIAKEALMQVENNVVMGRLVNRQYKNEFAKVGDTVNIRKPVKFLAKDGATLVKQDVTESNTDIVINSRKHVGWEFDTQNLTLTISQYSERYIAPAMIALSQAVDTDLCGRYVDLWNLVGTPGTTPSSFSDLGAAAQRLQEGAVPRRPRNAVLNPAAEWSLADGLKSVYVQQRAEKALSDAALGHYATFDTYGDQTIHVHTTGAQGGTPLVNGASQNVSYPSGSGAYTQSLVTDGWSASVTGVLKAGDVFTLAGVHAVNPVTKQSTGQLQEFVVTADADSNASGQATFTISPCIITSGPYQTVDAAPADNAALTVKSGAASTGYPQNLCFHPDTFALVTVPLAMPDGAVFKAQETHKGFSARVIKAYDIDSDNDIIRIDMLWGSKTIYPELGVRLTG